MSDRLNELKQWLSALDVEYVKAVTGKQPTAELYDQRLLLNWAIQQIESALAEPVPVSGATSDGYHTFDDLYHQRAILFAALSRAYKDKAWKSLKHSDGTMFDGGFFICGIETPEGQYTYHYKLEYWPLFAGKALDNAPVWDGHTSVDVTRLMSLYPEQPVPSEDVQRAIDWFSRRSCPSVHMSGEVMYTFQWCPAGVAETIEAALRQMRQGTERR